jgi:HlyD family secretion protein
MPKRLIPLFLACAALAACHKGPAKDAAAAVKPAESPFAAIANGKVDVEGGIIAVAARRGGIVREVFVQEGDEVVKGQILARQEDDEARLSAARAAAQVNQARAQLASLETRVTSARRELARLEKLVDSNFVAGQRVDEQRDELRQAEAAVAAQKASIAVAQAQANEAAYNLELTTIRAPVDGRIIRRLANPGSGASTLNVSNMFDIEPRAPRIVRAEAPESALPGIFVGQAVQIVPEFDASKTYSGKVLRRAGLFGARKLQSDDPGERADDRVVEVVVSADNPTLLIGQRVLVKFLKSGASPTAAQAPAPAAPARKP